MVGTRVGAQGGQETVVLEGLLGEGSYGKVFRATWKGTVVAVKVMVLPSYMSGACKEGWGLGAAAGRCRRCCSWIGQCGGRA
jgi:hypothetical protein